MIRRAVFAISLAACGGSGQGTDDAMHGGDGPPTVDDAPANDAPPGVICGSELLCENFEALTAGALTNNQMIGGFRADVQGSGTLAIDTTRAYSGTKSLKAHIDGAAQGGGRIWAQNGALFAQTRRHLYGRFMMWNSNDSNSVHWTIFGASGVVPVGNPSSGHTTTYLFSAAEDKKFMAVFYDNQTQQDCWHHATEPVPVAAATDHWTCVSFEADADTIRYRMSLDGRAITSFSVDTTGDGCLNAPGTTPWYGPAFDRFYLGALSFHPMSGPLDVWFDDLVVDTQPVECTPD
ncbi:MAG: hypothetical protein AB7T06_08790 [Kofleriaceae bacterium]